MRLFVAVLLLWVSTQALERGGFIPPLALWAWWTSSLFLCGAAAWADTYLSLPNRVAGLVSYTMFAAYYITMQAHYLALVPTNAEYPDLWPTLYMVLNLLAPIGLVTIGVARMAVQKAAGE